MKSNLETRLNKILLKVEPKEADMVYVREKETVENAVKRFNKTNHKSLSVNKVKFWRNFPFKNGKFFIGRNWSLSNLIKRRKEKQKLLEVKYE